MRKGLIQDAVLELTKLADANFLIKSRKTCLFGEVYRVCQIDNVYYDYAIRALWALTNRDMHLAPETEQAVKCCLLSVTWFS